MKAGYLSEYFADFAFKRLSAVEAEIHRSNQHEFNGVSRLRDMLGEADRIEIPTSFIYLADDGEPDREEGFLSWYDARKANPKRTEWRLYFPTTVVSLKAAEGDLLIIAKLADDTLLVIVAEGGSTMESQLLWLFGAQQGQLPGFTVAGQAATEGIRLEFAARTVLEQIGLEVESSDESYLESMLEAFGEQFPKTKAFSGFARSTLSEFDALSDPDLALMTLLEREELLFRTLEKHLIQGRLDAGFEEVDDFISFSLSVQNRRKSRAGHALENHLEFLFDAAGIYCDRTAVTEGRSKPDFLFPGVEQYHDAAFPWEMLTVLGVKSTCKDRWRQILAEADRVPEKHLLTLEPSISSAQTAEMRERKVQLVLPRVLHHTFSEQQRDWLMPVSVFFELVLEKQAAIGSPIRLV